MSSAYSQTDLLKELAQVAKHTDAEGVLRLVHALKPATKSVYGNRYALSLIADRIKTGGTTSVELISKWLPKTGVKGAAEFDVLCKIGGVQKILEIKSSLGAFRSRKALDLAIFNAAKRWNEAVQQGLHTGPRPQIICPCYRPGAQGICRANEFKNGIFYSLISYSVLRVKGGTRAPRVVFGAPPKTF